MVAAVPPALLDVRDLSVGFRRQGAAVDAVRTVSFQVHPGETVAIVGESGSGKTTLAHSIIGLLPAGGRILAGSIRFAGYQLASLTEREFDRIRGAQLGLVPQDPATSLNPVKRVGEQIAETLRTHGLAKGPAARQAAVDILDQVGIDRPAIRAGQYPHELSGGMRQRVLIGIAVACKPRLIIADEPTSALDATVQRRVLDTLDMLAETSGTAILLITHDLGVAADRADRILVMHQGRIVEAGDTARVLHQPEAAYTRALIAAAPSVTSTRRVPGRAPARPDEAAPPALVLSGISKQFQLRLPNGGREQVDALQGISLSVPKGRTLALVGGSGSGKSTAARIAARLTAADGGTVLLDGADITHAAGEALRRLRARMQLVYQNPYASFDPRFTVGEIIEEPLRAFGHRPQARRRRVAELLEQVALPPGAAQARASELSGGQRQRVAIARAIALKPDLLILDEPVSALDVSVQAQVLQLLVDLQGELGLSYLFITHDLGVVRQVSDHVAVIHEGRVVEAGETAAVFSRPAHPYTRDLLDAVPGQGTRSRH